MDGLISFSGTKTKINSFKESDITDEYIAWLNDEVVVQFSNQRFLNHTKESSLKYFNTFQNSDNNFLSIKSTFNNKQIGTLTTYFNKHHNTVDIGILIGDKNTWGLGFGLDAWMATMNWLMKKKKIRKITAGTLDLNLGMISIMKKSGMQQEAVRSKQEYCNGDYRDILYFSKFND